MRQPSRRSIFRQAALLLAPSLLPLARLLAQSGLAPLSVAAAGSLRPMLEGPLKQAAATALNLDLTSHAQGADAVAQALIAGTLQADLFLSITATPMRSILAAGLARSAQPFARTEMVLVYSPNSRFAPQFAAAAKGQANPWQILAQPGIRFARSNPAADPGGRNILFTTMLAARQYHQPDLVDRVLGPTLNPQQILPGINLHDALRSGQIDAAGSYRVALQTDDLPFISLPAEVNLCGDTVHADHPDVSLTLNGQTYVPEPLVFYAAVLTNAPNPAAAQRFLSWLPSPAAQSLFRSHHFIPSGTTPTLTP